MIDRLKYLSADNWLSKPRIVCGLMSGTSLDGVDAALVKIENSGGKHSFELLSFHYLPYIKQLKNKIKKLLTEKIPIKDVSELNFLLSDYYIKAILALQEQSGIHLNEIDLIGMHGQTVWHEPESGDYAVSTLQLGSASVLAVKLNIPVVSDFRSADIALGGQGAPLVPVFDKEFLSEKDKDIIALNIGGISNITYLPVEGQVTAFDTGPGNVLIDSYMKYYFNLNYDNEGIISSRGKLNDVLFNELKAINFIRKNPPKSTGRELFNFDFLQNLLSNRKIKLDKEDLIHTLARFTAWSIAENIRLFANPQSKLIVSGGGVKNKSLMEYLEKELPESEIISSDEPGINSDAKEAICFAYLAYRNIAQLPGNIVSVTGAGREAVLGSLTFP